MAVEVLDSLGRARLETVSGGNHLHRDRLGIRGQRHLVVIDDVEDGHALRHVKGLRLRHINTSNEEEER